MGSTPDRPPDSSTIGELREKGSSLAAPTHWTYSLNELRRPQERDRLRRPSSESDRVEKIPQFKAMGNNSFLCKIDRILRSNLGPEDKIIEYRAIVN